MPIIQAHILQGRSEEKKEAFIAAVTDAAVAHLDAPRETVRVILNEMLPTNYAISGETIKRRREKAAKEGS